MIVWKIKFFLGEAEANGFGAINKSLYSAVFPDKKKIDFRVKQMNLCVSNR